MENQVRMNIRPGLIGSGIVLLFILSLSAWAWTVIPVDTKIPVHWGLSGQPDRYGRKTEALLIIPIVVLFESLLFSVLPFLEPRKLNLQRSAKAYFAIWIGLLVFMAILHVILILAALGRQIDMNTVMPLLLGALSALTGNYLGKFRSNFFCGIRTPWTLSSELSWSKTHRLGGRLFVILGLCLAATVFFANPSLTLVVMFGGFLLVAAITLPYSYAVWRGDPEKHSIGRKAME